MTSSFHIRLKGSFLVNAGGAAAVFFANFFVAHFAGADIFGAFAVLFAWLQVIVVFAKFGFDSASQKLIAEYVAEQRFGHIRGFLRGSFLAVTIAAFAGSVVFVLSSRWLGESASDGDAVIAAALLVPTLALIRLTRGSLLGFQLTVRAQMFDPLIIYSGWLLLIALDLWRDIDISVGRLMYQLLTVGVVALAGQLAMIHMARPEESRKATPRIHMREWTGIALPMLLAYGLVILMTYTDTILIGMMLGSEQAGIYAVSSRFAAAVSMPIAFLGGALGPVVAELIARDDRASLQSRIDATTRFGLMIGLPVALLLLFGSSLFLGLVGEEYTAGSTAMQVLIIAQVVNIVVGPVGLVLLMSGEHRRVGRLFAATAIVNLVLNVILIPLLGIVGAAIATACAIVLRNLLLRASLLKVHGIRTSILERAKS